VTLEDFRAVLGALLAKAEPPTPAPDCEAMHRALQACPDTTDRALLDQACHAAEGEPPAPGGGPEGLEQWRRNVAQMAQAMLARRRFDEARTWCVIQHLQLPEDPEPLLMHAWCLDEQWTQLLQGSSPGGRVRVPTLKGWKEVAVTEHAEGLQRLLREHLRRALELGRGRGGAPTASYAGLAASLERSGDVEAARAIGREGVELGLWKSEWQRPAHFVPHLLPRQAWHDASASEVCSVLEQAAPSIKQEFERYMAAAGLALVDVGVRSSEAMLVERGAWQELPLFADGRMDHEVCSSFQETVRALTERCADATGLAFCGGGEVAFRRLSPGTRLKPHCCVTNVRLTCQLGVSVPLGAEPGVFVGGEAPRVWQEGRCLLFDDSFEHCEELDEMAEGDCVVLTVHFWHPAFEYKNDPNWKVKALRPEAAGGGQ